MRILVIDDDPVLTELLRLILRSGSLDVSIANTGADGVKSTREQSPDLIILDTMLPDMDGTQVCREVRQFSSVPILILSGLDTPGATVKALKSGADDYLAKPVARNFLLDRIGKLLERPRQEVVPIKSSLPF